LVVLFLLYKLKQNEFFTQKSYYRGIADILGKSVYLESNRNPLTKSYFANLYNAYI